MAVKTPALLTVSTEASVTDVYTSQTITPAAATASLVTLTSADIGANSGADLVLGQKYRIAVDGTTYWDTLHHDTDADEHFFRVLGTAGSPAAADTVTTISKIVDAEKDLTVTGTLAVDTLQLKSVIATDEDLTITDESVVYATTTSTNQNDVTMPTITADNHNRVIMIKVDVASGDVDIVPASGQQVAAGGADAKTTVDADATYILQANYYAATAPNWEVILSA